jgi:hypothetical protein
MSYYFTLKFATFIPMFSCSGFSSPRLQIPTLAPTMLVSSTKHYEMPPKNQPAKELPAKDPSQVARGQDLTTTEGTIVTTHIPQTSHPHISTESHAAATDARRPKGPAGQPSAQVEVFATNTAAPYFPPSSSQQQQHHNQDPHREAEAQDDKHQDFED